MIKKEVFIIKQKYIGGACLLAIIIGIIAALLFAPSKWFKDVPKDHWAYESIKYLTDQSVVSVPKDRLFHPEDEITCAEFTELVVKSTLPNSGNDYIQTARDNQLLLEDEFTPDRLNDPIKRQDAAKLIARTMEFVLNEDTIINTGLYTTQLEDWEDTCGVCKPHIAQAYAKGVIEALPDGSFGGREFVTRAQAAVILSRLIDPSRRFENTLVFDEERDISEDGRMRLRKAEGFMLLSLDSIQFYEENGKFYVKGDLPELPAGFENWLDISIQFKDVTELPVFTARTFTFVPDALIPKEGEFVREIPGMTDVLQIEWINISLGVEAPEADTEGYDKLEGFYTVSSNSDNTITLLDLNSGEIRQRDYDFSELFSW